MKIINVHVLDELGRILIPGKLTEKIGWNPNDQLTASVNLHEETVTFFQKQGGEFVLDDMNRVTLPGELLADLEWGERDKLAVTLDTKEKTVTLSLEEKYAPVCVFCKKPEAALTINGIGICAPHVSEIVSSGHK